MASRFVGRARELDAVSGVLDRAAAGQGSVVTLGGEAGIGKSRLALEGAELARSRGIEVIWSSGWPGGGAPAYWPWPEILAAARIGKPATDKRATADLTRGEGDSLRFSRFRSASEALERRSADQPLLVVVDDAHSLDADAFLLTRFVGRRAIGHRLVLLLAHRTTHEVPSFAADILTDIERDGTSIRLAGLDLADLGDFLVASGETAHEPLVRRIMDLTNGNPFLVEQVLSAGLHNSDRPVPASAVRLISSQLGALDRRTVEILECGAVLGPVSSLPELSNVASATRVEIERAREAAAGSGLVRAERTGTMAFSHDIARESLLACLAPERLADLHGRCLEMLAADDASQETSVRRARHALDLARCSPSHAERAVSVIRSSALRLLKSGSPEAAVELLRQALDLQHEAGASDNAALVTDLGSALLATGRLTDARRFFRRAVDEAERSSDRVTYARAALGLGGIWVQEHRSAEDRRTYDEIVSRAIAGIASDDSPLATSLRCSLNLRHAAERAALGLATVEEVGESLAAVRECGDASQLAAGLSLLHHVMLGPADAQNRTDVAREILEVALACGDELHTVVGLLWIATDALLLGHDADRALRELRFRADALGMRAILFIADALDVMRLSREGKLETAEKAAAACFERGTEVGDADASSYYGAHLLSIRWYQGAAASLLELARDLSTSPAVPSENPVFSAVVAALATEAGDYDLAESAVARVGPERLSENPKSSSWLVTVFAMIEAASGLKDAGLAGSLYDLLAPYASLPVLGSIGVCCFGSAERSLGIAARACGRIEDAIVHLEQAVRENKRLGNRPMTAIARADLAETLILSGEPGRLEQAEVLLTSAIEAAERLGLDPRRQRWAHLKESLEGRAPLPDTARCARQGKEWALTANGETARVPHTVGMYYLARLLSDPGTPVVAGELAGTNLVSTSQDVLDAQAIRSLRRRIAELEDEIDCASLKGQKARAGELQAELDEIVSYTRAVTRPGERSRRFDDPAERARTSVQKAITRAVANISCEAPVLAELLQASLRTGYRCTYEPTRGAPAKWVVSV